MRQMNVEVRRPTDKEIEEAEGWPIWEKEESKFPWYYDLKETCLIVEGEALVETAKGKAEFRAGDYVVFPEKLECTWEIKQTIRKHYKLG